MRRRHVARDLVGARRVRLDLLLGRQHAACARQGLSAVHSERATPSLLPGRHHAA